MPHNSIRIGITIAALFFYQCVCYIYSDGKEPGCRTITCENGGKLHLETCTCSCGPKTEGHFCEKDNCLLLQELKSSQWPPGSYSLPTTMHGCPEPEVYGWSMSYINLSLPVTSPEQIWSDGDPLTLEPNILGPYHKHTFQLNFCNKQNQTPSGENNTKWVSGNYCIFKGNSCPEEFQEGNITIEGYYVVNQAGHSPSVEIKSNSSVLLKFCCREDGFESREIELPNSFPFHLFKGYNADKCQEVKGMDVKEDLFFMVNERQDWHFQPFHPNISLIFHKHVGIPYCFYNPREKRECYFEMDDGFSYNGNVNTTMNGEPCMLWTNASSDYINTRFWTGEFEKNFCRRDRNSYNYRKPFCYVDADKIPELCEVPKCVEELDIEEVDTGRPVYHVDFHQNNFPSYAVDGKIDANIFRSTRPILKPWFQIDLQEYYEVHDIVVYRYKLWFPINFRAVGTYVSKNQWDFLNYGAIRCDDLRYPRKAHKYRFHCRRPLIGQYVTVRNFDFTDELQNRYFYMSFQEIKVLGKRTMCGRPLGLITGDIRDFQIESSSKLASYLPEYGTLYRHGNGWCADLNDNSPWFMVDLIIPTVVQGVLLQGWTVGQESKFITSFYISYGTNSSTLKVYQDVAGVDKIFSIDESRPPESPQRYVLWKELVTRFLRLDITSFKKQACLKLEIIGCPKRGIRDFWCANESIDLGYEELEFHDFWMEEIVPSPHYIDTFLSLQQCREECKRQNCITFTHDPKVCLLHDGHRYNKHFVNWWVRAADSSSIASQRLCFVGFYDMSDCGYNIYLNEGATFFIKSPGYPLHYGQGVNCTWKIKAQHGKSVRLNIIDVEMPAPVTSVELKENRFYELNPGYCKDKLIISSAKEGRLVITSDNTVKYKGTMLISSESSLEINLISCFHYKTIQAQNFEFQISQEELPGCGMDTEGCRDACSKMGAFIASPRYPAIYDANEICFWEISGRFGQYVSFKFLSMDIREVNGLCSLSYVAIYDVTLNDDTNLLGRYCIHNRRYEPIISSWHRMRLEFRAEYIDQRGSGFLGKYRIVNFTQSYGDITDKSCGVDWYRFEESCYKMFSSEETSNQTVNQLTWTDALNECQENGGHLLNIGTLIEMQFIHFLMTNIWKDIRNNEAYIGLSKRSGEDNLKDYSWSDGSPLTFTAWFKDPATLISQPDGLMNEKCTMIRLHSIHTMDDWHDVACAYDKVFNFICEKVKSSSNITKVQAFELVQKIETSSENVTALTKSFNCNNSELISSAFICDGVSDCSDETDESFCGTKCTWTQYQCTDGRCISLSLYCDFRPDCEDSSDELLCVHPSCNTDQWPCINGQCIDIKQRCDLKFDCIDLSDEAGCIGCNNFQCYDTKCIFQSRVCDGQIDCSGKFLEDENQECTSNVQQSCSEWFALGVRKTGEYFVSFGLKDSVPVECIFETTQETTHIYTIVHHRQEETLTAHQSRIETRVQYFATAHHIRKLMAISTCTQAMQLICHFTENNFWWKSSNGNKHFLKKTDTATNCSCPFVEKCEPGLTKCNCDKMPRDWYTHDQNDVLIDEGVITNQNDLPVIELYTGNPQDTYFRIEFTLGPLVCKEDFTNINSKSLLCRSGVTVDSAVMCLLDFDEYGEMVGCRDLSHLDSCENYVCPAGYAKCVNSYCIPVKLLCDGIKHCKSGEDEICDIVKCPGLFRCHRSKVCLSSKQICDGTPQCPEADDEHLCNQSCPMSCFCDDLLISCKGLNITNDLLNQMPSNIRKIDMSFNTFVFKASSLYRFASLAELNISHCGITMIYAYSFILSRSMYLLDLSYNMLTNLLSHTFDGLQNLRFLFLEGNVFTNIGRLAFNGLLSLPFLHVFGSRISSLTAESFTGLKNLRDLNITGNNIHQIKDNTFANLSNLISLDLRLNDIRDFSRDIFKGLDSLQYLFADNYVFCCLRPPTVRAENCLPQPDEFSSCSDLMRIDLLRWFLWIIGLCAFLGNVFVLIYRFILKKQMSLKSHGILIYNLSLSDLLMGVYLLIIAAADIYYSGRYIWNDHAWRNGLLCKIAGVLSTVSSEASVMFISLITLDRFVAVKFPFGQVKFTPRHSKCAALAVWIVVLLTGILPTLPIDYFEGFYSRSAVCLALPLTRNRPAGWEFSITIFIFVNFVLFCLIAFGQLLIYREVVLADENIKSQRRNQDMAVARSLFVVVFTDFLCWFPLGVMGIMALSGRVIPGDVYAWAAVFVLPINSALNPFLYTFSAIAKQKRSFNIRFGSKKFTNRSGNAAVDICQNDQLILGNHDTGKQRLTEYMEQQTVTTREIYVIVLKCAESLHFLHERDMCHGNLSQNTVFPDLHDDGVANLFLQVTPKLAVENDDMPSDVLALGRLVKHLLKVRQGQKGRY